METVRLARMAMASRFELIVRGDRDPAWLRAAGEEALAEVTRLDAQLSFYSPASDISRINRTAHAGEVPVEPRLFRLLILARDIHAATDGAFDITVGPLMRCWGFTGREGGVPDQADLRDAMKCVGMHLVQLDENARTIRFKEEGIEIDLGGIGKGYAIDEAMSILQEAGVHDAFLHGGTSSMKGVGRSPEGPYWNVAISAANEGTGDEEVLAVVPLSDRSLSVSDVRGKWFEADDSTFGHVLDPRSGRPVSVASLSAVECRSASLADALSTALLVAGAEERETILRGYPEARFLVASGGSDSSPIIEHCDFAI